MVPLLVRVLSPASNQRFPEMMPVLELTRPFPVPINFAA